VKADATHGVDHDAPTPAAHRELLHEVANRQQRFVDVGRHRAVLAEPATTEHATSVAPTETSTGSLTRQSSTASGQRGWNGQPEGRLSGDAGTPPIGRGGAWRRSRRGRQASSPRVYGCDGVANTA